MYNVYRSSFIIIDESEQNNMTPNLSIYIGNNISLIDTTNWYVFFSDSKHTTIKHNCVSMSDLKCKYYKQNIFAFLYFKNRKTSNLFLLSGTPCSNML